MLVLVVTCILFAIAAYGFSYGTEKSISYRTSNPQLNVLGLVTANITAGTGFVYLLLNGARNGLLACLLPLALLAGYRVLAKLLAGVDESLMSPNFLEGTARAVEAQTRSETALRKVLVLPLLFIFLLLLTYELFATSQLLAGLIWPAAGIAQQVFVTFVLLCTTVAVCYWGGEGMLRTERLQAALIVACLLVLALLAVLAWKGSADHAGSLRVQTSPAVLATLAFAAIGAFNTQLYSVLNWNAIASVDAGHRRVVLYRTSYLLAGFAFILLLVGASMPTVWSGSFSGAVHALADPAPALAFVLFPILITGVAAITLTTTQGITMALAAVGRDALRRDSAAVSHRERGTVVVILVMSVVILGCFYFLQPNLFFLLLAVVSGAEAVMPLIILMLLLGRNPKQLGVLKNRLLCPYAVFFGAAIFVNLILSKLAPERVPFVALGIFALSCLYSAMLYSAANRAALREMPHG